MYIIDSRQDYFTLPTHSTRSTRLSADSQQVSQPSQTVPVFP